MSQQLTAGEVAALAAKASRGPWTARFHETWGWEVSPHRPDIKSPYVATALCRVELGVKVDAHNAAFIAAAPAMAHLIETQSAELASMAWRSMRSAPKDGTAVLALMDGSDVPHAVFYGTGGKGRGAVCWRMKWDHSVIADHDGPLYWMPCPADPRDATSRAAQQETGHE